MIELKIDGIGVDIDQKTAIAITLGIADVQEPGDSTAGYSKTIELPFTPRNMRAFRFVNELYSKEQFNNALHVAEYIVDGTVVMSGIAQIEKFTYQSGAQGQVVGGAFHVTIVGAAFEWITNAKKKINELQSNETLTYTLQNVYDNSVSWGLNLIKFFPIDRGAFWRDAPDNKYTPRKDLDILDYHPFINVWGLILQIFQGYTVRTSLDPFFRLLHISGSFPEIKDLPYIKEDNDFKVGTTQDNQELFDNDQPVNIFDNISGDGFTNSGVIAPGTKAVPYSVFTPKNKLSMRFKIDLVYFAKSKSDASGGYTGTDYADVFRFAVDRTNPNIDMDEFRFPIESAVEYEDRTYDTDDINYHGNYYVLLTLPEGLYTDIKQVDAGSSFSYKYTPGAWISVYHITNGRGTYQLFAGKSIDGSVTDWVNVKDIPEAVVVVVAATNGGLTFSKTLYTAPRTFDQGAYLPLICAFGCSNSSNLRGVKVSVGAACVLTPVIGNYIGIGDKVGISTVGGTALQIDFLSALRQMYNLMFYTNPLTREVFIEPRTVFYNMERKDIIDWRAKIDYSKSVEVHELGGDVGNALRLSYADGGDVIKRYNWKNRTDLGSWRVSLLNKTSDETKEIANPMFAPFIIHNVASVGMTLPQTESEKTQERIEEVDLDINLIIGCFAGVVDRTAGSDLAKCPKYPRLVFQDAALNINLGFGDLSGAPHTILGLNQYYQDNISAYNNGRRITMYLKLNPLDVEALLMPNTQQRDLRGVFMIRHNGEDIPCLLEQISDYNAADGVSTKCQFISDPFIKLTGDDMVVVIYGEKYITHDNTAVGYQIKSGN